MDAVVRVGDRGSGKSSGGEGFGQHFKLKKFKLESKRRIEDF
jgi:hypothetical protein